MIDSPHQFEARTTNHGKVQKPSGRPRPHCEDEKAKIEVEEESKSESEETQSRRRKAEERKRLDENVAAYEKKLSDFERMFLFINEELDFRQLSEMAQEVQRYNNGG